MTLTDYLSETVARFQTNPPAQAFATSARELRLGVQRRLGPHIGRSVWERGDWDVLVVLDACRVDQMQAVTTDYPQLAGRVESVWSNASCSIDWIRRTFNHHSEHAQRAGYVTANPFADHDSDTAESADLSDDDLAYFAPLYRTHWQEIKPGIATVPPEPVTDYGIAAWRQHDQLGMNRLVLHYMQPHEPYRSHPEWGSGDSKLLGDLVNADADAGSSVWPQVEAGHIPEEELWAAGVDNLHWVLDDVMRLLENIDARVVLTADHGNAMGEWGEWHHPPGALSPTCRKVPWMEVDAADEQTSHPDVTVSAETRDNQHDADAQLEALGYK